MTTPFEQFIADFGLLIGSLFGDAPLDAVALPPEPPGIIEPAPPPLPIARPEPPLSPVANDPALAAGDAAAPPVVAQTAAAASAPPIAAIDPAPDGPVPVAVSGAPDAGPPAAPTPGPAPTPAPTLAEGGLDDRDESSPDAAAGATTSIESPVRLPLPRPEPGAEDEPDAEEAVAEPVAPLPPPRPPFVALVESPSVGPAPTATTLVASVAPEPPVPLANPLDLTTRLGLGDIGLPEGLDVVAMRMPEIISGSCHVPIPLEVSGVGGVGLSPSAIVNVALVKALGAWLHDVQVAAEAVFGQRVTSLYVVASYSCRGRNGDPNAQLSEHAFGNAIDIAAFRLADGRSITVRPYASRPNDADARFFTSIRADACGPFKTVLGPGVELHDDHFHLDMSPRGSGTYCV